MSYLLYGEAIREARKRCGLTQEELAYGICSVSTLSKIENGKQQPHILTFEALMQRMGADEDAFFLCMSEEELACCRLLEEINEHVWNDENLWTARKSIRSAYREESGRMSEGVQLLEEQWSGMAEQWFLFRRTIRTYVSSDQWNGVSGPVPAASTKRQSMSAGRERKDDRIDVCEAEQPVMSNLTGVPAAGFLRNPNEAELFRIGLDAVYERTLELLRLTLPECSGLWMEQHCFSHCELLGWLLLGYCSAWLGHFRPAFELGRKLLRYTKGRETDSFLANLQAGVWLLLSRNFQLQGKWKYSAGCCRMGVEICLKRGKYHLAARMLDVLGACPAEFKELAETGSNAGSDELLKELKQIRCCMERLSAERQYAG